jgi:hypothetical protein
VVRLKQDFQQRIREAEALKLDLAKAEATIAAATGGGLVVGVNRQGDSRAGRGLQGHQLTLSLYMST